jgi:Zn finger protein HypA/HybF involved in hydrogenase expression
MNATTRFIDRAVHDGPAKRDKIKSGRAKDMAMKCQRCLDDHDAKYRVYSEEIDIQVCPKCAEEALRLGISIKALDSTDHQAVEKFQ